MKYPLSKILFIVALISAIMPVLLKSSLIKERTKEREEK